jgi:tetratricopeptide (TPR) repeat protein
LWLNNQAGEEDSEMSEKQGVTVAEDSVKDSARHFFKMEDWIAAIASFAFATFIFYRNMAPEVTLQDSGELVTGAFTFGVPHPPGYPLWALLGYVWSHFIIPFGNPAWRIGMMSVFTGGLTVGIMTIMMTRSTRVLLHTLPWTKEIEDRLLHWIALAVGVSSSLLFGFNRGVWLWASVSEMRVLNAFSFILIACFFFAWMVQPQRKGFLYASLLTYGLSMTNHQTVAVMALALVAGTFALGLDKFFKQRDEQLLAKVKEPGVPLFMKSLSTFWDLTVAVLFSLAVVFYLFAWLKDAGMGKVVAFAIVGIVLLFVGWANKWVSPKYALIYTGLFLCGCAFYLYMPIAASTNPPMNWGFASTKEGFLHAITRGQYEKLQMADPCGDIIHIQIWVFIRGLLRQYSPYLCCFGLVTLGVSTWWLIKQLVKNAEKYVWLLMVWVATIPLAMLFISLLRTVVLKLPFAFSYQLSIWGVGLATLFCLLIALWLYLEWPGRSWGIFIWAAFLASSLGLIMIINPKLDRQEQEITIKFFAPAHGFYAMLIGYGIAMCFAGVLAVWRRIPKELVALACIALLALPLIPYKKNYDLCALSTHDFGYQFGYRMFCPGGGYPDMEKDAVLFGGTDPGRFVPTYMIFCESRVKPQHRYQSPHLPESKGSEFNRSDVYIITQNALADGTYMNYIRNHYDYSRPNPEDPKTLEKAYSESWQRSVFKWGWEAVDRKNDFPKEPIRIPSPDDSARAFQQFVAEVQNGTRPNRGDIVVQDGRVQVTGALAVMEINGILAKNIFDWNKDKHAFYVEESYVIQWMYPYLSPAGVIMKINKEMLPAPPQDPKLWQEIFAKDKAYWDKLTKEFTGREEFMRNADAKKSFSKMRSAIAGLYLYRGMVGEAEYAFRQSIELCPDSPEGNFRLAELYMNQRKYAEARKLIAEYLTKDEYNNSAKGFLNQITEIEAMDKRRAELQAKVNKGGGADVNDVVELMTIYARLNLHDELVRLSDGVMANDKAPVDCYFQTGILLTSIRKTDKALAAFRKYVSLAPREPRGWVEMGWLCLMSGKVKEGYDAWRQAVALGGEATRSQLRSEQRFQALWQDRNLPAPFRELVQPTRTRAGGNFGF